MRLVKPSYYDHFRCLAGACPDSCCKEWDVQVDDQSARFYRSLPGELGDHLRAVLKDEDGETVMTIVDGRCPMWQQDGLCRIQAELGHDALCKTCQEFPRLTHDYGDFVELGLELSCPEATRMILSGPDDSSISVQVPGGEAPQYDTDAMALLLESRKIMRSILSDTARPVGDVLALGLMYGYQAQAELDGAQVLPFDADAAMAEAARFAGVGDADAIVTFFKELELLNATWETRLNTPSPAPWSDAHLALARYFVDRYWLQAVSDYDLISRVKLGIISCLVIKILGGNTLETAQQYSKEIENSAENVDTILDGAYSAPAFTDDKLLGLLLSH